MNAQQQYINEHLDIIRKRAEIEINKFTTQQSSDAEVMNLSEAMSLQTRTGHNHSLKYALCHAAATGRTDIVQGLLASGLCRANDFASTEYHGSRNDILPLQLAVLNNHYDTAQVLLEFGAEPHLTLSSAYSFQSPIIMAETPEMTDLLLQHEQGANPSLCRKEKDNPADVKGRALLRAIDTGLLDKAVYLIRNNANVNFEEPSKEDTVNVHGRKNTPLTACIQRIYNIEQYRSDTYDKIPQYAQIALMLLNAGANANHFQETIGTPLIGVSQLNLYGLNAANFENANTSAKLLTNTVDMKQLTTAMNNMLSTTPNQPQHMLSRPVTAQPTVTRVQQVDFKTALVEALIQGGANVFFVWHGQTVLDYYKGQPQEALIIKKQHNSGLEGSCKCLLLKARELFRS